MKRGIILCLIILSSIFCITSIQAQESAYILDYSDLTSCVLENRVDGGISWAIVQNCAYCFDGIDNTNEEGAVCGGWSINLPKSSTGSWRVKATFEPQKIKRLVVKPGPDVRPVEIRILEGDTIRERMPIPITASPDGTYVLDVDTQYNCDNILVQWSDPKPGEAYASWVNEIEIYTGCVVTDDCDEGQECDNGFCVSAECGNGVIEAQEECDDGNLLEGDGCSSICTIETCQIFVTKDSCFAFTEENCTWTPPLTTTQAGGGGCCPKDRPKWDAVSGKCGETGTLPCTVPWLSSYVIELRTGVKTKEDVYGSSGAIYEFDGQYKYCAKVTKEVNWGLWYDVEIY